MSTCEKCWEDAHHGPYADVPANYARLMKERKSNPCTPEQQAGPEAGECSGCGGKTLHQYTGECMAGCQVMNIELTALLAKCRTISHEVEAKAEKTRKVVRHSDDELMSIIAGHKFEEIERDMVRLDTALAEAEHFLAATTEPKGE